MIYLYIKEHTLTGLKYFGKTIQDPYKYKGSGIHWKNHCKKHGWEYVVTTQVFEFATQDECTNFALSFSKQFNIVESDEWANHIVEDGLGGRGVKGRSRSPEFKQHMSEMMSGRTSWHKGRKKSDEFKRKLSEANKGKIHSLETKQKLSEYCGCKNSQYGSKWINNGTINRKIRFSECIPEGWYTGRLVNHIKGFRGAIPQEV